MDAITQQILSDRAAIVDALAAYCRFVDDNEPERLALVFTDDCQVSYGKQVNVNGRDALINLLRSALAQYAATSHLLGGVEIGISGDRAAVISVVHAWHRYPDGSSWAFFGRYVDGWLRTPDGWRIAERNVLASDADGRSLSGMNPIPRESSQG